MKKAIIIIDEITGKYYILYTGFLEIFGYDDYSKIFLVVM